MLENPIDNYENKYCSFFTKKMKTDHDLYYLVFDVVKNLLMNELEIACLAIYLERLYWDKAYSLHEYLIMVGLAAKVN